MTLRVVILTAALGACSGSSKDDCSTACSKLYEQCRVEAVTPSGQTLSQSQCVEECQKEPSGAPLASCLTRTPCEDHSGLEGCLKGTGCGQACATVYGQCGLALQGEGRSFSEVQCLQICEASARREQIPSCVTQASCNAATVAACFQ